MKIGKYEIENELGHGAMGVVYRARDPLLDRLVAIKLVSAENVDARSRLLFEREAKTIAKLSHPNIVVVYDYNYHENEPYIVMELLNGTGLDQRAAGEDLPFSLTLDFISQTLTGLQHAHEQGVIHRDIKPSNIFITESNSVKILDFGIARLAASGSTLTSGYIIGTPDYMSPEQVKSEPLDGRSDLFSVGTMLYRLFVGKTPFSAENAEATMHKIVNAEPHPLNVKGVNPFAQTTLQKILNRALSKDPADRFASAADMAKEIKELMLLMEQDSADKDDDLEYADTIRMAFPKFSTTKAEKKDVPVVPVPTPPKIEPVPETTQQHFEPTMQLSRDLIPSPAAPEISPEENTPEASASVEEPPRSSKKNLTIALIALIVAVILLLIFL